MAVPPPPHSNPFGAVAGTAAPTPAHHIPGNTLALREAGPFQKNPAKNMSLGQGRPRKTRSSGEGDQTGPQAGPLEGQAL